MIQMAKEKIELLQRREAAFCRIIFLITQTRFCSQLLHKATGKVVTLSHFNPFIVSGAIKVVSAKVHRVIETACGARRDDDVRVKAPLRAGRRRITTRCPENLHER